MLREKLICFENNSISGWKGLRLIILTTGITLINHRSTTQKDKQQELRTIFFSPLMFHFPSKVPTIIRETCID